MSSLTMIYEQNHAMERRKCYKAMAIVGVSMVRKQRKESIIKKRARKRERKREYADIGCL